MLGGSLLSVGYNTRMPLATYRKKRSFAKTPEPSGLEKRGAARKHPLFVVQKHDARQLHYDLRLEAEGVLKSWAVPKGPSLNPKVRRLAMKVEDHPRSYARFEGEIPEGNYGAGDVIVWDTGTYAVPDAKTARESERALMRGLKKGDAKVVLSGKKLKGGFALVRMKGRGAWLLIKERDRYASTADILKRTRSAISRRVLPRDRKK